MTLADLKISEYFLIVDAPLFLRKLIKISEVGFETEIPGLLICIYTSSFEIVKINLCKACKDVITKELNYFSCPCWDPNYKED